MKKGYLPRRTFLRGAGTLIALPLLDAMIPATRSLGFGQAASDTGPKRLIVIYWPIGTYLNHWWPSQTGRDFALSPILKAFQNIRSEISVLGGLKLVGEHHGADHCRAAVGFATGKGKINDLVGQSFDQTAAGAIGRSTNFPSLVLQAGGDSNGDLGCDGRFVDRISYVSDSVAAPRIKEPWTLFDSLFPSGSGGMTPIPTKPMIDPREKYQKSVLDSVLEDAAALNRKLGKSDQKKLDEYLTSLRELERRIQVTAANSGAMPTVSGCTVPNRPMVEGSFQEGFNGTYPRTLNNFFDLSVSALQCDKTRVITYMLEQEGGGPWCGNFIDLQKEYHFQISHSINQGSQDNGGQLNDYSKMTFAWMSAVSRFLEKLKSVKEGSGTLLDNCMVLIGSGISAGDSHSHDNLPILLAGRGGGTLNPGVFEKLDNTPLANVQLTLLRKLGLTEQQAPNVGDSTGLAGGSWLR